MENRAREISGKESFLWIQKGKGSKTKSVFSSILTILAIASLLIAFIYGKIFNQADISGSLAQAVPDNKIDVIFETVI